MKRLIVFLACALPAMAGVQYDFTSSTATGASDGLTGTVFAEGSNLRMDVKTGDNFLFKSGSVVLSTDGGKSLSVFDSAAKTYYVINVNDLTGAGGLLQNMGGMFKMSFNNPKVAVRDLGDGGTVSGYPTRHAILDSSYDIAIDAMGAKINSRMAMSTETWTTDKIGAEFTNFLQQKSFRTGYDALDKLIAAQASAIAGRFPLKQVTTIKVTQGNGGEITSTTTSTVSNIQKKTVPAATFVAPTGYARVDDPVTRMMKSIGR